MKTVRERFVSSLFVSGKGNYSIRICLYIRMNNPCTSGCRPSFYLGVGGVYMRVDEGVQKGAKLMLIVPALLIP
jgi:hypothetical protein